MTGRETARFPKGDGRFLCVGTMRFRCRSGSGKTVCDPFYMPDLLNTYSSSLLMACYTRESGTARFIRMAHGRLNGRPSCQITPTEMPARISSSMPTPRRAHHSSQSR